MQIKLLFFRALFLVLVSFYCSNVEAQTYVTWTQLAGTVSGTFPGGTVTVTQSVAGNSVDFFTPSFGDPDLEVTGNQTFGTIGPNSNPPSKTTTFTFSVPVIITQYNMADIDRSTGGWNDSMEFTGVTFTSAVGSNCAPNVTGAIATTDALPQTEWAKWYTSIAPVTSFTINYVGQPGSVTHAYLGYAMQVMVASTANIATVSSTPLCTGSSSTVTVSNSIPGTYSYVWTVPASVPNPGNVSTFTTTTPGTYTVVATNTTTMQVSAPASTAVNLTPTVTPTFSQVASICAGGFLAPLPTTSLEGVNGLWSPAINNMQTTTYTFTPTTGQCALPVMMTITVIPTTIPTFTQVSPICNGGTLAALPTISNNGITGFWTPALNNTATTPYTFIPNAGQCASNATMTIVVNPTVTPTFNQPAPICAGSTLAALPNTSIEGINGAWSPAPNNNQTTLYTFTPSAGECATATTLTIVVNPILTPTFDPIDALCFGDTFTFPTTSLNGISGLWSPAFDPFASQSYTFTPTSGNCATTSTVAITVKDDFEFEITESCVDGNFLLTAKPLNSSFISGTASYEWEFNGNSVGNNSDALNVTQLLESTTITETLPLDFNVSVTNDGCTKSMIHTITMMFCGIQKGISVNSDGANDFFDLRLLNVSNLQIFNRYGMEVFSKKNYYNEWRGQMNNGETVADGVYFYRIDFATGERSKTGWIYVISKS